MLKGLSIHIFISLIYIMLVKYLNRYSLKNNMESLSVILIIFFVLIKYFAKIFRISYLRSPSFTNGLFILLCIALYIPILMGGISYIRNIYNLKHNSIIKSVISIISIILILVILLIYWYDFWFIVYIYLKF